MPDRNASGVPRANPRIRVRAIAFASGNRTRVRYTDGARRDPGRAGARQSTQVFRHSHGFEIG
jgi:hypothetical protein